MLSHFVTNWAQFFNTLGSFCYKLGSLCHILGPFVMSWAHSVQVGLTLSYFGLILFKVGLTLSYFEPICYKLGSFCPSWAHFVVFWAQFCLKLGSLCHLLSSLLNLQSVEHIFITHCSHFTHFSLLGHCTLCWLTLKYQSECYDVNIYKYVVKWWS